MPSASLALPAAQEPRRSVLFVCTANRCRSPGAAALFRRRLAGPGLDGSVRVESAGTWASQGLACPEAIRQAARAAGLDLAGHRSRGVSRDLLRSFAVILVMEGGQREALRFEFPEVADRIHLLTSLAGPPYDVADPQATDVAGCRRLIDELDGLLEKAFERILTLAGGP